MNKKDIISMVDHTLLKNNATWFDIKQILDDAIEFKTASVCIPPCYVKSAFQYASGRIPICTVIGFPLGYSSTEAKLAEAKAALNDGASEIDVVINIGYLKDKKYNLILDEIKSLKELCKNKILKVIIETCLLSEEEKIVMCEIVSESGADYIKTSTGFSSGGATIQDVELMKKHCSKSVGIKAAGGIRSFEDAENFISAGATRLGTSALIKIYKTEDE